MPDRKMTWGTIRKRGSQPVTSRLPMATRVELRELCNSYFLAVDAGQESAADTLLQKIRAAETLHGVRLINIRS